MADCPNKQRNLKRCNCTYSPCERKGVCCECMHYHRAMGELPGCFFPGDRSLAAFLRLHQHKQ